MPQTQMVNHQLCFRMIARQRLEPPKLVPAQNVHRQPVDGTASKNGIDTRMVRCWWRFVQQHESRTHGAGHTRPVRNLFSNIERAEIKRPDKRKALRISLLYLARVTRVVSIHGPW